MLVTPPPYGHPLYKQRGSLQSAHNKHIKNNPYIELTLLLTLRTSFGNVFAGLRMVNFQFSIPRLAE